MTKVAHRYTGRYITSSGMNDALIECGVFSMKALDAVLKGNHYVHTFNGILIVSEVVESLTMKAFRESHDKIDCCDVFTGVADLVEELKANVFADGEQRADR